MLDSGWVNRHSAVIAGLGGGILVLGFLMYGFVEQTRYNQFSQTRAANFARYAAEEQKNACVGVSSVKLAECKAKAQTEYNLKINAGARDYSDLIAQRKSALWAMIMGIAALIGMVLSVIGVILVKRTFDETQRTNLINMRENARSTRRAVSASRETAKALEIAQKNAEAAELAVNETRRIGEAQVRCYLTGKIGEICFVDDGTISFSGNFTNTGQSPAIDVMVRCELWFMVGDWIKSIEKEYFNKNERVYTIGGGTEEQIGPETFVLKLHEIEFPRISKDSPVYIQVVVTLLGKDVFGNDFETAESFHTSDYGPTLNDRIIKLMRGHKMRPRNTTG